MKPMQGSAESSKEDRQRSCYILLLSRASPLPCRKVYGPVGSSMPVTLPRVIIRERSILSGRALSSEIRTPFTVNSDRRKRGTCSIVSLRGIDSCFCPGGIRRRNSCSAEVNSGAAKAWSVKIKVSRFRWGQSSRHGSSGTSGIPNSFLQYLSVVQWNRPSRRREHRRATRTFLYRLGSPSYSWMRFQSNAEEAPLLWDPEARWS